MRQLVRGLVFGVALAMSGSVLAAGTDRWNYSGSSILDTHKYMPYKGYYSDYYDRRRNAFVSYLTFTLSQKSVDYIYNSNLGVGACFHPRGRSSFFTIDIRANPESRNQGKNEVFEAYSYRTNLPRFVRDFEKDYKYGFKSEADFTVTEKLKANKKYYIRVYWKDKRNIRRNKGGGNMGVNFTMSSQWNPWSDFNNCLRYSEDQTVIVNPYNSTYRGR